MTTPVIDIQAFGDAACPWDFSAEPARLRLLWRYGDALRITHRMVGLSSSVEEYSGRGVSLGDLAHWRGIIRDRFGMPIDATVPARHQATIVACRAVVGMRLRDPAAAERLLRRLRVLAMSEHLLLDERRTIVRAAGEADLDPDAVAEWADRDDTAAALAQDMAAARRPRPAAVAMAERLARTPEGGWRYTCPSYVVSVNGTSLDAPGFQPARVYEVLVANLAPQVTPNPEPTDVRQVLEWAPYPLATAEVAGIMEVPVARARELLAASDARPEAAANDAYWSA